MIGSLAAAVALVTCNEHLTTPSAPDRSLDQAAPVLSSSAASASSPQAGLLRSIRARFPRAIAPSAVERFDAVESGLRASLPAPPKAGATVLTVDLPTDAAGPARVGDVRSGIAATFALEGAAHVPVAIVSGYAVYPGAAPGGGDVIHRPHALGDEDFVHYAAKPEVEALRYHVDVGLAAGLRLVDDTLELLDATGTPRLRVAPPVVVDAGGRRVRARLSLEGCAADTDPRGPWGRAFTPPGAGSCVVAISWGARGSGLVSAGAALRYPVLVDPSWQSTSSMVVERWDHAAVPLPSLSIPPTLAYRVLITGGFDTINNPVASAEIYEPLSQTFTVTSPMNRARGAHTATSIPGSATGRILIAGGADQVISPTPPESLAISAAGVATAQGTEIYDEVSGVFSSGPSMSVGRFFHTAVALVDGRILLAGGATGTGSSPTPSNSGDLFTPDGSALGGAIASAHGPMQAARFGHAAALLSTGAVLLTGGIGTSGSPLQTAEAFCPANDCASFGAVDVFLAQATQMATARAFHTATALHTGDVLVAGGVGATGTPVTYLASAELYSTGSFQGTLIPMAHARAFHAATKFAPLLVLTTSGTNTGLAEVLLSGGFDGSADLASAEAYFPAPGAPGAIFPVLDASFSRRHAAAVLVNDGSAVSAGNGVLVMGGISGTTTVGGTLIPGTATASAELFFKTSGDPCASDGECLTGHCADGFCCDTACGSDCFACAASLQGDGGVNGTCQPSAAGTKLGVVCTTGSDVEVHNVCDGMGHVTPDETATIPCKPDTCGANNHCSTFCDDGANKCASNGWCNFAIPPDAGPPGTGGTGGGGTGGGSTTDGGTMLGTCQTKGPPSESCTDDSHCAGGFCYDGFCCDSQCDGQCQACDVPGMPGKCTTLGLVNPEAPHPGGLHPRMSCAGVPTSCEGLCMGNATQCGYPDGLLDGGGVDTTKVLKPPDCSEIDGGTLLVSYPCDGTGSDTAVPSNCGGFHCQDPHACRTQCSADTDCIQDHICVYPTPGATEGTCQLLTGPECDGNVTLRRPSDGGGNQPCPNHYACPAGATACDTSCTSVNDCASGYACDDTQTCVLPLTAPALPSCSAGRTGDTGPGSAALSTIMGLLAAAWLGRSRWGRSPQTPGSRRPPS